VARLAKSQLARRTRRKRMMTRMTRKIRMTKRRRMKMKTTRKGRGKRTRKKREKEGRPTKADPRSRNLFGKMLGHLHSAKDRLNKEKTTKSGQMQMAALAKVDEKVNLTKMNIKEFRKGQFSTNMVEEKAKLVEIEKMIGEKEKLLLQRRLEQHYGLMMNFIRTKAQPTIFFMPAKHTRDSEKQLEETRAAIKHKISSLKVQLQQTEDEVEAEEAMRASAAAAAAAAMEEPETKKENGDDKEEKDEKDEKDEKEEDEPAKKKQKTEKKEDDSDES